METLDQIRLVSAYTHNSEYESAAKRMAESAMRHGMTNISVIGYNDRGSWERNCAAKAEIMLETLSWMDGGLPLVWVDADGEFVARPDLFTTIEAEFAIRKHDPRLVRNCGLFMSGTIFARATPAMKTMFAGWVRRSQADPMIWDQKTLHAAWDSTTPRPSTMYLPVAYCRKFDEPDASGEDPVIIHHQMSRITRRAKRPS